MLHLAFITIYLTMYILDQALAQQIVDRTMKIIGFNINVMNNQGIIIGSGDPGRLNQQHDGALLALSHGHTVEIDSETATRLSGVKPGINLILHYQEQVIGVVGITGLPDEVRLYGRLVKMTAEMIVEQAALVEQLQWDKRHKEELLLQLIQGDLKEPGSLYQWGERLGLDLHQPRVVVVIEVQSPSDASLHSAAGLKQLINILEHPARDNWVAVVSLSEVVVLKPVKVSPHGWDPQLESQRIDTLLERLQQHNESQFKVALGHYFEGLTGIAHSYQTAKQALQLGKQQAPDKDKYLFQDLRLPVLLSAMTGSWQAHQLLRPYHQLCQADRRGLLRRTLQCYLDNNGEIGATAQQLHIHRNTLRYRLEKIHTLTGLDITRIDALLELYLAHTLFSMNPSLSSIGTK